MPRTDLVLCSDVLLAAEGELSAAVVVVFWHGGLRDQAATDLAERCSSIVSKVSPDPERTADLPAVGLPAPHRDVDVARVDLKRPRLATGPLGRDQNSPLPQKGSSTKPPRREQSLIASATNATGLTVGCIASSSSRPARMVLTPA